MAYILRVPSGGIKRLVRLGMFVCVPARWRGSADILVHRGSCLRSGDNWRVANALRRRPRHAGGDAGMATRPGGALVATRRRYSPSRFRRLGNRRYRQQTASSVG